MNMDFSASELAFRTQIRAFLDANLSESLRTAARLTPTVFTEPAISREWQRILHHKGWLAHCWPKEVGGPGWSPIQRYIFETECALANAPELPTLGLRMLGPVLQRFGTADQQQRYLPKILSGEHYWCQGFSEPGSGSDLASLECRATRSGDRWIVNGTKLWTTHAHFADHMFCLVRTDPAARKQAGISFLLIDMRQPGIRVQPIHTLANDHEVNTVFLDGAVVPEEDMVGVEGQGWTIAKFLLENERGGSCHAPALLAKLATLRLSAASAPAGGDGVLADDPSFTAALARTEIEALALETTELRILTNISHGLPAGPQTSLVKLVAARLKQQVSSLEMRLYAYAGLQLERRRPLYGCDAPAPVLSAAAQIAAPAYLNNRAWSIFGGTNEMQRSIIAKTVLGL
jgi:alkylation response protein AidB-like acyl-CoA dehydrogenase